MSAIGTVNRFVRLVLNFESWRSIGLSRTTGSHRTAPGIRRTGCTGMQQATGGNPACREDVRVYRWADHFTRDGAQQAVEAAGAVVLKRE